MATPLINLNLRRSKFVSLTDYFGLSSYQNASRPQSFRFQTNKPKRPDVAIDGFVPIFGPRSSLFNINNLIATNLDSFPSSLNLERSLISLCIIKRLGAECFLVAALAELLL